MDERYLCKYRGIAVYYCEDGYFTKTTTPKLGYFDNPTDMAYAIDDWTERELEADPQGLPEDTP